MKERRYNRNMLDMVPKQRMDITWTEEENGNVVVELEHRGFYAKIAQSCFQRPRVSKIHLDALGSYTWKQIDGSRSLYEIARRVGHQFGKQAEPLYERFLSFIQILRRHGFVELEGVERRAG